MPGVPLALADCPPDVTTLVCGSYFSSSRSRQDAQHTLLRRMKRVGLHFIFTLAGVACGGSAPRSADSASAGRPVAVAPSAVPAAATAVPVAAAAVPVVATAAPGPPLEIPAPIRVGPYCSSDGEELALQCADGLAARHADTLLVQTVTGPVALVNVDGRDDEQQTEYYRYVGTLRAHGVHHVIHHSAYELGQLDLYSGVTGRAVDIASAPMIGPDGRYFATAQVGLDACEDNTPKLEIWRLADTTAVREWNVEPWDCRKDTGWAPSDVRWVSADTLRFTHVDPAEPSAPGTPVIERTKHGAMVVRRGARWILVDPQH